MGHKELQSRGRYLFSSFCTKVTRLSVFARIAHIFGLFLIQCPFSSENIFGQLFTQAFWPTCSLYHDVFENFSQDLVGTYRWRSVTSDVEKIVISHRKQARFTEWMKRKNDCSKKLELFLHRSLSGISVTRCLNKNSHNVSKSCHSSFCLKVKYFKMAK